MLGQNTQVSNQDRIWYYIKANVLNKGSMGRQATRCAGDYHLEVSAGAKTLSLVFQIIFKLRLKQRNV